METNNRRKIAPEMISGNVYCHIAISGSDGRYKSTVKQVEYIEQYVKGMENDYDKIFNPIDFLKQYMRSNAIDYDDFAIFELVSAKYYGYPRRTASNYQYFILKKTSVYNSLEDAPDFKRRYLAEAMLLHGKG